MNFDLDEERTEAIELTRGVFARGTDPERMTAAEESGFDERLWGELAESGVLGMGLSEQFDGAGLGWLCILDALVEHGRRPAPVPLWETLVLGALPLEWFAPESVRTRYLPKVVTGECILTAAWADVIDGAHPVSAQQTSEGWRLTGDCTLVPFGDLAEAVLVPATTDSGPALFFVPTDQDAVAKISLRGTNRGRFADLALADAQAELISCNSAELDRCQQLAWLGLAALQVGLSDESVRLTAAHVTEREQFGVPLGTFQAVGHQLADAAIWTEAMRLTLAEAGWRMANDRDEAGTVHVARWWACEYGPRVARACQHLHGGLGADVTSAIHRYFLWSIQLASTWGSPGFHADRIADDLRAGTALDPGRVSA